MGRVIDLSQHVVALRHFDAEEFAAAERMCRDILGRTPGDPLALRLLGLVHRKQGALDEAVRLLRRAVAATPPDAAERVGALNDLAAVLRATHDYAAALRCCVEALALDPSDASTLHQSGNALAGLNRHAEALDHYQAARAIDPDRAAIRFDEGYTLLALGRWPEAWDGLEYRLSLPSFGLAEQFVPDVPQWRGESDISGKTILVQAEQGLGDTLQYIRFVPQLAGRAGSVVVRAQWEVLALLRELPGAAAVISLGETPPAVDVQCPLLSLPRVFRTTPETLPAKVPYLSVPPAYRLLWQTLLGRRVRPRIGIAWSGRQHIPQRSMPLAALTPLLTRDDLELHSLQQEVPETDRACMAAHPQLVDHGRALRNFADTAALVSQMDLVVTIDTSVAHVAGALGRPMCLMLPFSAGACWLLQRTDTPWYPTARLFRQSAAGEWAGVVDAVMRALPFTPAAS